MAYTELQKKTRCKEIVNEYLSGQTNAQIVSTEHEDGYINVLNKYGTQSDNSEAYEWISNTRSDPFALELNYEGNGLFAKIIDTPASEAVKHGFDLKNVDEDVKKAIMKKLDNIGFIDEVEVGIKWTRLFGGGLMVMLIDDGGSLDQPVNYKKVRGIEEIHVFESPLISWNQATIYNSDRGLFGVPEFFEVSSQCGSFRVHHSRCLCFKNGRLPENASDALAQFWGVPEYTRIKSFLREAITSTGFSVRMMERSVQPVYGVKDLASLLQTPEGEDTVVRRLQVIDLCRSMLNTIAVDANGETYDFRTAPFTGVQEVIDAACNLLSAVTNIPQTILFGRSPAGMNATGESDFENYYNSVEHIQTKMLRRNFKKVIDLVLLSMLHRGEIEEIPDYELEFNPLWSLSETEQATVDQSKAQTALIKAQTAQTYVDIGALDPTEVRAGLASSDEYEIEELLDSIPAEDLFDNYTENNTETEDDTSNSGNIFEKGDFSQFAKDGSDEIPTAAAVIVVNQDGYVLCGVRSDNGLICGPGGHIEDGEAPIQAAIREAQEEFNITPTSLISLTVIGENKDGQHKTSIFFCNAFEGTTKCDEKEMHSAMFLPAETLLEHFTDKLFAPFKESLLIFQNVAQTGQHSDVENPDDCGIINDGEGNPNHDPETGQFTSGNGTSSKCNSSNKKKTTPNLSSETKDLRPIKNDISYNDYDFESEKTEYEQLYPESVREENRKRAEDRAQFKDGWQSHDMDEVIRRLIPNAQLTPPTDTGKEVFCSTETSLTVCYDLHVDYFTVVDESINGKDRYRDIEGKSVLNYTNKRGTQSGRPRDERKRITHFKRRKT